MRVFYIAILALFWAESLFAGKISPVPWSQSLERTIAREQIEDISRGIGPQNQNNMMFYHTNFFGDQTFPLDLQNSEIFGYPFHQKMGLTLIFDSLGSTRHGVGYYYERAGWDRQDFLVLQPMRDWAIYQHSQSAFYTLSVPQWELLSALGWRGSRGEFNHPQGIKSSSEDEWFAMAEYRFLSVTGVGQRELNSAAMSLNPWSQPERNLGFPKWTNWIPRLDAYFDLKQYDYSYFSLQQKIWTEYAFLSVRANEEDWQSTSIDLYLDPMHFFSVHVSALNVENVIHYGWKTVLGPVILGYNDPDLYFASAGLKSSFFVKVGLNISTLLNLGYMSPGGEDVTMGIVEGDK